MWMACAAAMEQAEAEGLTLIVATSRTGYFGVRHELSKHHQHKPYQARVFRGGKQASLGYFTTAEEAALCVARSPQGQLIAKKGQLIAPPHGQLIAPPLTSTEALQQARAEGLTLVVAKCTTGYRGVYINNPGSRRPFQANGSRYGKRVSMGNFATAEEAALYVARWKSEWQPATKRVRGSDFMRAAAPPLTSEDALAMQQTRDHAILNAVALDIICKAAGAAEAELSAEVAAEVISSRM